MKDLLLNNVRSSITRSFWAGALFQGFLGMAFQSWVSGIEILRSAQEGSAQVHWSIWFGLSLPVFLYYRRLRKG
ncbi:MAG: hypothetical protein KJ558_10145 [Gammaproteobacteria bacterium]|nr:hypothetical protein [Gammaproteobacteria bacterium]MBU1655167.1 hypothetical protein [Gammaproteobacteria bacterium]MBU1959978.1 hypothetical protein [Gammaproteobacteria bacterium]